MLLFAKITAESIPLTFTVDVHRIFRDFDADVNNCNSYDFEETDKYILSTEAVGTKTFYRLGSRIEPGKKREFF